MNDPRVRAVPFQMVRAADGNGLTLEGYAAVFNDMVRIFDPWDGEYDETFARGAFTKSMKERTPYLMFQHGRHPMIGSLPIGSITELAEDSRGLRVKAQLADNWLVEPVRAAIANGSVSGMSIMFEPMKDKRDDSGDFPVVTRTEVKLLELGPVVFPAYDGTSVGVRSLAELNDLRPAPIRIDTSTTTNTTGTIGTFQTGGLLTGGAWTLVGERGTERILTTKDVPAATDDDPAEPLDAVPEPETPATPEEAALAGTSEEAGNEAERASVQSTEVLALLARNAARRYPTQGSK
jgi:HK97 family phage prohead protease